MLSDEAYQEAVRRYKNMRVNGRERQRYHALILVHQGYSYREVGRILLVDEETIRRWVEQYHERGLGGLRNHPQWGGEHGQRELSGEQVEELQRVLREEAMAGTQVDSGWTNKAVRQVIEGRLGLGIK
jgi:transposase